MTEAPLAGTIDVLAGIGSFTSGVGTLAAVVAAGFAAIYAKKQVGAARAATADAIAHRQEDAAASLALRTQEAQPAVVIDVVSNRTVSHGFLDLEVTNTGPTTARDVRFSFAPPLTSSTDEVVEERYRIANTSLLKDGLLTLVPGRSITRSFDFLPNRDAAKHADRYEVHVTYLGIDATPLSGNFVIDLATQRSLMSVTTLGVHHLVKEVQKLREQLSRTPSE